MVYRLFLDTSRTQPARTIVGVIAILTILAGLWIFTPWYIPFTASGPAFTAAFNVGQVVAATVNTLVCLPAVYAAYTGRTRHIARGAWWLFIWYTFVTMTRLVVYPLGSLYFITSGIIAVVLSIVYIEQKFLARRDES